MLLGDWFRLAAAALYATLVPNLSAAQPTHARTHTGGFQQASKTSQAVQPRSNHDFRPVDAWFTYEHADKYAAGHKSIGGLETLRRDLTPEDSAAGQCGTIAEEIIVIGERQRRDFALLKPNAELTGPQALEAFQPYVPLPGATCTYKNLCYDMAQPPLRATIPRLLSLLSDN